MKPQVFMALCCVLAACGQKKPVDTAPPAAPQLQVDGNARLTDDVVPTAYRLDLTIDPAKDVFAGSAEIDIEVKSKTQGFVVHADGLEVSAATFTRGDSNIAADLQSGENNGLGLAFMQPLEPGPATLKFSYTAPLDEVPTGLYRVKDGEDWYAFTQFEPLEARQAFPSFDEPKFKTPFTVTLRVPTGQLAFANTPETSRDTVGELDVFKFATSKPLPTYLVAFAAGPLDVVEGPPIGEVPFRLIATKGKGALGQYMVDKTPAILNALTEYFGQPYPYEKLDVVAVPNFSAGAMENVGLVTFRETLLLFDPAGASTSQKYSATSVMAHELAHMWFGNLVTLPWWDEIWLNEGFATWMASKIVAQLMPELESEINTIRSKAWIMGADSLENSTPVRQEIRDGGDVYNAFGTIAYGKGRAVLSLFEAWLGEDVMRDAVRHYLAKHQHGTGTTESLLASMSEVSGKPVTAAMATFLDQAGVPMLALEKSCAKDKVTLNVTQSRYLPAGSPAAQTGPWSVPVCVAWPEGKETKSHCQLVTKAADTIELPASTCPDWYYPNAGQVGYYLWNTEQENFDKLTSAKRFAKLDTATKLEVYNNLAALSRAEVIEAKQYVAAAERLMSESHHALARQALTSLREIYDATPEADRPAMHKRAAKLLAAHLKRVGLEPKEGEDAELSLLRPSVVRTASFVARDAEVKSWAKERASQFGKKMSSVPAQTVQLALPIAAEHADASVWLSYKLMLSNASDPLTRVAAVQGLGSFRDPQLLRRSLDLFFTDEIRSQDFSALIYPSFATDATYAVTWQWFTQNFDKIVKKVGTKRVGRLPGVGSGFCSAEGRAQVATFFADPAHQKPGFEKNLADTLEEIDQCIRRRVYLRSGLSEILK